MATTGWKLNETDRLELLERFPPEWPDVIADHITLEASAAVDEPLPDQKEAEIVGGINDDEGLQVMVVAINGSIDRPDGGIFHITWSLDRKRGRKAYNSNTVIAERGWRPVDDPIPIRISPARFD